MRQFHHFFIILFMALLGTALISHNAVAGNNNTVLGEKPVATLPISHIPQWEKIIAQNRNDQYGQPSQTKPVNVQTWEKFTQTMYGVPKLRQLLKVNMWFEQFPYKQDNWVYKKRDYWATPTEFLTRGGDCEDYAIIKYMTLRQLGFPASAMKIAFVYDVYSGTDHAFLVVKHNDAEFILDNREKVVVSRYMKNRYRPHFAFNEEKVWTYNSPIMARTIRKDQGSEVIAGNR